MIDRFDSDVMIEYDNKRKKNYVNETGTWRTVVHGKLFETFKNFKKFTTPNNKNETIL